MDLFVYLRKNAKSFKGTTLLVTAAYCRDKKIGRPMGSGERDLVKFATNNQMNLSLLPFRTGDIITKGVASEKKTDWRLRKNLGTIGIHSEEALHRSSLPGTKCP